MYVCWFVCGNTYIASKQQTMMRLGELINSLVTIRHSTMLFNREALLTKIINTKKTKGRRQRKVFKQLTIRCDPCIIDEAVNEPVTQ